MYHQEWGISCTKEEFEKIKLDESFLGLLTLARFVNALQFCQKAAIDAKDDSNPSGVRSRINSFLFASSVLYEGFLLVERLSNQYKNLDSFKNGFGALLRDKPVTLLRTSVLKRARDKFVFHFDRDVAKEALQHFDIKDITFASGIGKAVGEMYFGLADELVINYLLTPKENESNEILMKRYTKIVNDTTTIMVKFSRSAEILMADVLKDMGFVVIVKKKHENQARYA